MIDKENKMAKVRTTYHNGRKRKDGSVFDPRHNDRTHEGIDKAEHIDGDLSKDNVLGAIPFKGMDGLDFAETEAEFYTRHFSKGLEAKNERYKAQRHGDRVQTIEDVLKNPRTCPEESIIQIGDHEDGADMKILKACLQDQLAWEREKFPQVRALDVAIHADEPNAGIHAHVRRVFVGHDRDGHEIPSQEQALKEMGVERPDLNKPRGRYNNRKITYTNAIREHWIAVLRDHGLVIEDKPKDKSKTGLALDEYKAMKAEERAKEAEDRKTQAENKTNALQADFDKLTDEMEDAKRHFRKKRLFSKYRGQKSELDKEREELDAERDALEAERQELAENLQKLRKARTEFDGWVTKQKNKTYELQDIKDALATKEAELEQIQARGDRWPDLLAQKLNGRVVKDGKALDEAISEAVRKYSRPVTGIPRMPNFGYAPVLDLPQNKGKDKEGKTR